MSSDDSFNDSCKSLALISLLFSFFGGDGGGLLVIKKLKINAAGYSPA